MRIFADVRGRVELVAVAVPDGPGEWVVGCAWGAGGRLAGSEESVRAELLRRFRAEVDGGAVLDLLRKRGGVS